MIKIEFNDTKLEIPNSWQDLKLGDYEKWFMQKTQTKTDYVHFVADVCKIDAAFLLDSPAQLFEIIVQHIQFIFDTDLPPSNRANIEGEDYYVSLSDKLTLAEWVDVESVLNSESNTKISEILAVLCRPAGETYDSDKLEQRAEQFRNLTCEKALPLINFFLYKKKKSDAISNHYSTVLTQADQLLKDIKTFVQNGAGTKRLPIWQKIKYIYLMKSLEKQLSKFSGFYFTR